MINYPCGWFDEEQLPGGKKWNVLIAMPTWSWKDRKISVDTIIYLILN